MTIKKFLLTLMMVSKQISYFKPQTFIDKLILKIFNFLWYIIEKSVVIEV